MGWWEWNGESWMNVWFCVSTWVSSCLRVGGVNVCGCLCATCPSCSILCRSSYPGIDCFRISLSFWWNVQQAYRLKSKLIVQLVLHYCVYHRVCLSTANDRLPYAAIEVFVGETHPRSSTGFVLCFFLCNGDKKNFLHCVFLDGWPTVPANVHPKLWKTERAQSIWFFCRTTSLLILST